MCVRLFLGGRHVLVQNVPALSVHEALLTLFSAHGNIEECRALSEEEFPRERFTEVYLLTFAHLDDARLTSQEEVR